MSIRSYVKLISSLVLLTASIAWSYTVAVTRRMGLAQMERYGMTNAEEIRVLLDKISKGKATQ